MAHTCDYCGMTAGEKKKFRDKKTGVIQEKKFCGDTDCVRDYLQAHPELELVKNEQVV